MGCCASKASQPELDSAKFDDVSAPAGQRVGQQFEPPKPTTRPPEYSSHGGSCSPPPRGRLLSLDQRQQSNPNKVTFVPSQGQPGRRLSLDQRLQNPQVTFVPSQGQRLSLDHTLLDQKSESTQQLAPHDRYPYAYPSQGRRQSLDQIFESAPNDYIQPPPLRQSGPDARAPPSSRPRSPAKARAKGATVRQKGRRSKRQVTHAYLNLDAEFAHALLGTHASPGLTGLLSPGPQFSLRGRLVHSRARASGDNGEQPQGGTRAQQFVLAPEDGLQYLMWRKQRGRLELLQPPSKINRDVFQGPMVSTVSTEMMGFVLLSLTSDYSLEKQKAVGISSVPKFPCINTPEAGGVGINTLEAEGAINFCHWKGEGSGFGYLRRSWGTRSRDC